MNLSKLKGLPMLWKRAIKTLYPEKLILLFGMKIPIKKIFRELSAYGAIGKDKIYLALLKIFNIPLISLWTFAEWFELK